MQLKYVALDSETELIAPRASTTIGKNVINLSPFVVPELVVISWAEENGTKGLHGAQRGMNMLADYVGGGWQLHGAQSGITMVANYLRGGWHLVFHNAPFDLQVFLKAGLPLDLVLQALDEGRIHDTAVLEQLLKLSQGHYDMPRRDLNWGAPEMTRPRLKDLAYAYAGLELDKGDDIRLPFGQFKGLPLDALPERHKAYALQDAVATLAVFQHLRDKIMSSGEPEGRLFGEAIQVRADFCASFYDQRGVRVDRAEAALLRANFERDVPALQAALVARGMGRWVPLPGTVNRQKIKCRWDRWDSAAGQGGGDEADGVWRRAENGTLRRVKGFKAHHVIETAATGFHLSQNTVRERLGAIEHTLPKPMARTAGGQISIVAEDWAEYIPAGRADMQAWIAYEKVKKIIGTYLRLYSSIDEVFPRWKLMVRTGRRATSNPNIQNIPKRKHGIRSLFVPREGYTFVKADYSFQELITLAEVMHGMGIAGPMSEAIKGDPHRYCAALLLSKPESEVTKTERQAAKAVNFGCPGGLGPAKLAEYARKNYNQAWTLAEAADMRNLYLKSFWDVRQYLGRLSTSLHEGLLRVTGEGLRYWKQRLGARDIKHLKQLAFRHKSDVIKGIFYAAERGRTVQLPTGRVRGACRYTEAGNTYFQGLASDVTKTAEFLCFKAGLRVILVVHDEIVLESNDNEGDGAKLRECMLEAFRMVCPVYGHLARVEVSAGLDRWGPATDKDGKAIA